MKIEDEAQELRKMWGCYWQSRVLLTANNLRVFNHLRTPRGASEVAQLTGCDARATEILLDAVAGLGLIKKRGRSYRNSPMADRLLVTGTPFYQGDILRHADNLWKNWSNLDEIVRTGQPSRKSFETGAFIRGMHNIAVIKAKDVISEIDLKGVKKALDLGGGPGTYSIEMARKIDSVSLFDRPETISIARDFVSKAGVGNISFIEGDFQTGDIGGGYDIVFISQVLHAFSNEANLAILKKAFGALNPGGRIVIHEHYLSADRTGPVSGSLFSVNMLVNTHGGRSYAVSEMKGWLKFLGFKKLGHRMMEDNVLVFGKR